MWDTPFDPSMLGADSRIAICCPEEYLADELFEIFRANGVGGNWNGENTNWNTHKEKTTYYCSGTYLQYGSKMPAETSATYSQYTKCTFYGIDTHDLDTATDDELCAFLGIGGV